MKTFTFVEKKTIFIYFEETKELTETLWQA